MCFQRERTEFLCGIPQSYKNVLNESILHETNKHKQKTTSTFYKAMPDLWFLTDGASIPKDSACASFSKLYNPGTKPLTIDIRHRPSFRNICLGLIPWEVRIDGQRLYAMYPWFLFTHSLSVCLKIMSRGEFSGPIWWMSPERLCFFFSHTLPHLTSHCFYLSSFLTSTSIMTAPLAGARWLPINNSHITQVQRGEPDEPPAGAHLLPASLWLVGVPTHGILSERAWHS